MTNEEAIKQLKEYILGMNYMDDEAVCMAIEALEQQPCEDCISREAVDEYITNLLSGYLYDEERTRLEDLTAFVWELPPVIPTRPTGKWIEKEDYNLDTYYECSECGADYCIEGDILIHKYCPNCGARMVEMVEMVESEE